MMFFQRAKDITHNLVMDFVRLIRDMFAIANDFYPLPILQAIVNTLDSYVSEPCKPEPNP